MVMTVGQVVFTLLALAHISARDALLKTLAVFLLAIGLPAVAPFEMFWVVLFRSLALNH